MAFTPSTLYDISDFSLLEPNDVYSTIQFDSVWSYPSYPVSFSEENIQTFFGYDEQNKFDRVNNFVTFKRISYRYPAVSFSQIESFIATVNMYNGSFNLKLFEDTAQNKFSYIFVVFDGITANSIDGGLFSVQLNFVSTGNIVSVENAPGGWGNNWGKQWGDF